MLKRVKQNRRGQSIVEYLVIAGVIIAAILGIRAAFRTRMNNLMNQSQNKVDTATTLIGNNVVANRQ